ncbi:protein DMR6-LIKE OXYGENASE 2-like [Fagus crenata]
MASAIPNAVLVDPPKTESVKSLAESTCLSSLPSIYTITHNLHAEAVSNDPEDSVPIVDISLLASGSPDEQSQVIQQIGEACLDWGCFMVINHGVPERVMKEMVEAFLEFFNLTGEEKQEFQGKHVMDPIRCGTGFTPLQEKVFLWRDYLKFFTHPEFHSPNKPAGFRYLRNASFHFRIYGF